MASASGPVQSQEDMILANYASQRKNLQQQKVTAQQQLDQGLQRRQAEGGLTGGAAVKGDQLGQKGLERTYTASENDLNSQQNQALQQVAATKQAQGFQTSERLGSEQFAGQQATQAQTAQQTLQSNQQAFEGAQANLGRQFSTSEREAVQTFQDLQATKGQQFATSERLSSQDFADMEAKAGRTFSTSERQAVQAFQDQQRQATEQYATGATQEAQQFQAGQAAIDRSQQDRQFAATFGLQGQQFVEAKRQFDQQMAYQYNEFDANQQTNFINGVDAMKQIGFNQTDISQYSDFLAQLRVFVNGQGGPAAAFTPYNPGLPSLAATAGQAPQYLPPKQQGLTTG